MESLLSVGIDIGTSTTSMVVSRLYLQNMASCFAAPRAAITKKEVIYRGEIYQTPQERGERIDADAVAEILRMEYQKAGITPDMVQTGAVIITGESSRKENAALVTQRMSDFAGDFVVATAGPDLESVIAAKGAGTQAYSEEHSCTAANIDIGGGTSNIAVFRCGELVSQGCFDIGGRLARVEDGRITYVSPRLACAAESLGISLSVGDTAEQTVLRRITDRMAEVLGEAVGSFPQTPLCAALRTKNSSLLIPDGEIDCISFSGGVADYIYHPSDDWFRHGDIGVLLADSVRAGRLFQSVLVIPAKETIRATVVGAGSYTTTLSGSTISFSNEALFPFKNIPAFVPDVRAEAESLTGDGERLAAQAAWFLTESAADNLLFCFRRVKAPSYGQLCALADAIAQASAELPAGKPLLVLTEQDFAKALGQALRRRLKETREVVCVDGIQANDGDFLDFGRPLMDGMAIPVVVKTLLYG